MEEKEIRIRSDGRRLDIQLSEASGLSRSRAAALMEAGYCRVDGEECRKAGTKAAEGRTVVLTVPAPREAAPQAEDIPLEVLYEDDDLAVVIKPRGMVVHPAAGHEDGTLVKGIKRHPDVGDRVVIYAGATVLGGDTQIGSDCVIGGSVWLTHSVPAGKMVLARSTVMDAPLTKDLVTDPVLNSAML